MTIRVRGLKEARKAFKQMDKEAPKLISRQHKRIASLIVPLAKAKADARPRDERTGHISRTITARGSQTKASIAAGGVRAEDIFVQEFGGRVPLFGDSSKKFSVRPRKADGYFMYPAIAEKSDTIQRIYTKAMEQAISRYFET